MPDYYSQVIASAEKTTGVTTHENPHQIIGCLAQMLVPHLKLSDRIANLNPDCAEIGAGMLASLVAEARMLLPENPRI